jgi:hypothetical protein
MTKLTPPDLEQCQADRPNGYTFMTLGGRPGLERCKYKPTIIVKELKPGEDGQCGSMALCWHCFIQFKLQAQPKDGDYAFAEIIWDKALGHVGRLPCKEDDMICNNGLPADDQEREDAQRLVRVAKVHGRNWTELEAFKYWEDRSSSYGAGWLFMPESDEALWEDCLSYEKRKRVL